MRRTAKLIGPWSLVLIVFGIVACDEIEDPVIPVTTNYLESVYGPPPVFNALPQAQAIKRVLVEDFTAHQCGNCPAAAIIAEGHRRKLRRVGQRHGHSCGQPRGDR